VLPVCLVFEFEKPSGDKQISEKGLILAGNREKHTSGAKARGDPIGLMSGLKP
jgi:hypothetical protein